MQSIVKEFPDKFMESINNQLHCTLCSRAVSCNKRFLVDSHRNTSKYQKALGSRSENLITQTSQMFLRSSDTDFVEKVTKAFLSADIPLYKLNNTHIKSLFRDIGHRLPSETSRRTYVVELELELLNGEYVENIWIYRCVGPRWYKKTSVLPLSKSSRQ